MLLVTWSGGLDKKSLKNFFFFDYFLKNKIYEFGINETMKNARKSISSAEPIPTAVWTVQCCTVL